MRAKRRSGALMASPLRLATARGHAPRDAESGERRRGGLNAPFHPALWRRSLPKWLFAAAAALSAALASPQAGAAGEIAIGFGLDDLYWRQSVAPTALAEVRPAPVAAIGPVALGPGAALEADADGDLWAGGGVVGRLPLGDGRWRLTASAMAGAYRRGAGSDLGRSAPIFRSQIEIGRALSPVTRIGLAWSHKSNAYLARPNPGVESLYLTLARRF
jgi:hypothetical protein